MSETNLASFYFHQGTNYSTYEYLGCNLEMKDGKYHYTFRTWAPRAEGVCLVSEFSGWDSPIVMHRVTANGIFECEYISDYSLERKAYKFRIYSGGRCFDKGDPYARFSKGGADGASLIFAESNFKWNDKKWLSHRDKTVTSKDGYYLSTPVNIYEVHLGSFMRHESDNSYLSYREIADQMVPYLKFMGYTHVEFLPLAEFPFDGSWGYQICGFYAPTSRFGDPDDFRYMINKFHENGIGVILDWVPAHFPRDAWGLFEFDGYPLYEYQGVDRMESRSWGTRFFDLGREEVQCFLVSNALYFLREFHLDGLRVDAVASMLYLDYDKDPGEWIPNHLGTNVNLEGVAFMQKLNSAIFKEFPSVLMIAEESASYGKITHPVSSGGLGFNLKWNMGFANDFHDYVMTDPLYRKHHHSALTFPLMYAFSENYVLPISHDEVVHGKMSFLNKMHGTLEDKFWQMRTAMMLISTYPGKKMTFMGTEYGQFREWDYENSLEWFMLDYPNHRQMRNYVSALNKFYLTHSELYDIDFSYEGFEWLSVDENEKNLVAYRRKNRKGESLIVIVSFSGTSQSVSFRIAKPQVECLFDTGNIGDFKEASSVSKIGKEYLLQVNLPAFSGVILKEKNINKKSTLKENKYVL